jgi:hypothetical protein
MAKSKDQLPENARHKGLDGNAKIFRGLFLRQAQDDGGEAEFSDGHRPTLLAELIVYFAGSPSAMR